MALYSLWLLPVYPSVCLKFHSKLISVTESSLAGLFPLKRHWCVVVISVGEQCLSFSKHIESCSPWIEKRPLVHSSYQPQWRFVPRWWKSYHYEALFIKIPLAKLETPGCSKWSVGRNSLSVSCLCNDRVPNLIPDHCVKYCGTVTYAPRYVAGGAGVVGLEPGGMGSASLKAAPRAQ